MSWKSYHHMSISHSSTICTDTLPNSKEPTNIAPKTSKPSVRCLPFQFHLPTPPTIPYFFFFQKPTRPSAERKRFRNGFIHERDGRDKFLHRAISRCVFHHFGYDGRRLQNRERHVCVPRRLQQAPRRFGPSQFPVRRVRAAARTGPIGRNNGPGIASLRWLRPQQTPPDGNQRPDL